MSLNWIDALFFGVRRVLAGAVELPERPTIAFGSGITATDNPAANRTDVVATGEVPAVRTITAGAGLTGGGSLAADRTLNVGALDGSIDVQVDGLRVGVLQSDAQHGTRGGAGLHAAATEGENGFMTTAMVTKLGSITAGAAVASVGVTTPLANSGSATAPVIEIAAASGSTPGSQSIAHYNKVESVETGADVTDFANVSASLGAATTAVSINHQNLADVATPTSSSHAANKDYVDARSFWRARINPTANIANLAAVPLSQDGATIALNDRVMLTDQTDATQNGLYYASAVGATATLTRAPGATAAADFPGMVVLIAAGTARWGRVYRFESASPPVMGASAITFVRMPDADNFVPNASDAPATYNAGGTTDIEWLRGKSFFLTMTGNTTLSFSGGKTGVVYILALSQDATGGRTITWPADVHFIDGESGAPNATADKLTIYHFYVFNDVYFATKVGPFTQ